MTGRMQNYQQKKAMQQSLILLMITLVLLAVFLLLIMPLTIRIYDSIKKGGILLEEDTIPPQVPALSSLVEATNSAQLSLSGYGEPQSTKRLMLNGAITQESEADLDGNFSFIDFVLSDGENTISVVSLDEAENATESKKQTILFDNQIPTLEITMPTDGSVVTKRKEQLAQIKGVTEPKSRVLLNDKLLFIDSHGNFSGSFQLNEGENVMRFHVIDLAGNQIEQELRVSYQP